MKGQHNKSMDVSAKQRLSYRGALLSLARVKLVRRHVNSIVRLLTNEIEEKSKPMTNMRSDELGSGILTGVLGSLFPCF